MIQGEENETEKKKREKRRQNLETNTVSSHNAHGTCVIYFSYQEVKSKCPQNQEWSVHLHLGLESSMLPFCYFMQMTFGL